MWNNKVIIITGGSSGIGFACTELFLQKGTKVAICARNSKKLQNACKKLEKYGADNILPIVGDVSVEKSCKELIQKTITHFGRIDVLINNAGISMRALFSETELSVIKKLMDINFWGTVYCTKFALPEIEKNGGSVVGISSIAGKKGLPGRAGYSASKFAMEGFLECLRIEYLKKNLHVMVCCPGFTASNIRNTALSSDGQVQGESPREEAKMMTADAVAQAILQGIEKKKRTVVLTTTGKLTVLLNKFCPKWMDKQVYKHMAKEKDSPLK